MTKTLTVNIPAKTLKLSREVRKIAARVETLTQDDAGQWFVTFNGGLEKITEAEAIDVCVKGSNWSELRAEHFPMHGFHN